MSTELIIGPAARWRPETFFPFEQAACSTALRDKKNLPQPPRRYFEIISLPCLQEATPSPLSTTILPFNHITNLSSQDWVID